MKTLTLAVRYGAAVVTALSWLALLKVACVLDRDVRRDEKAGKRMGPVDDAFDRLDKLHFEIFGRPE